MLVDDMHYEREATSVIFTFLFVECDSRALDHPQDFIQPSVVFLLASPEYQDVIHVTEHSFETS